MHPSKASIIIPLLIIIIWGCTFDKNPELKSQNNSNSTSIGIINRDTPAISNGLNGNNTYSGIYFESKELAFKTKLLENWKDYKTTLSASGIIFYLPTKDTIGMSGEGIIPGYFPLLSLHFYTRDEWNRYLKYCQTVKPEDYGSYYCTDEGINKSIFKKTGKYIITRGYPQDRVTDAEKYYNDSKRNYLDFMKENLEEI